MAYWLMKTEPDVYNIDDMKKDQVCFWEGVRNYQARNFMRDRMKEGDYAFFYHSNAKPPGIVGVIQIVKVAVVDDTAFDSTSRYYDAKSTPESPRWYGVDVRYVCSFPMISLQELKADSQLNDMLVVQKGSRLSVHPVEEKHFLHILNERSITL